MKNLSAKSFINYDVFYGFFKILVYIPVHTKAVHACVHNWPSGDRVRSGGEAKSAWFETDLDF